MIFGNSESTAPKMGCGAPPLGIAGDSQDFLPWHAASPDLNELQSRNRSLAEYSPSSSGNGPRLSLVLARFQIRFADAVQQKQRF